MLPGPGFHASRVAVACRCLDAAEPITLDDHSVIVAEGAKEFIWEPEVLIFPKKLLGSSSECGYGSK